MRFLKLAAVAASAAVLTVIGIFDPEKFSFFPKCPFLLLTGLKCPGCGSQRAIHQLLHLHVGEALHYNALAVVALPVLAFLLFAELFRRRFPRLALASSGPAFSWSILVVVVLWWILRNIVTL